RPGVEKGWCEARLRAARTSFTSGLGQAARGLGAESQEQALERTANGADRYRPSKRLSPRGSRAPPKHLSLSRRGSRLSAKGCRPRLNMRGRLDHLRCSEVTG